MNAQTTRDQDKTLPSGWSACMGSFGEGNDPHLTITIFRMGTDKDLETFLGGTHFCTNCINGQVLCTICIYKPKMNSGNDHLESDWKSKTIGGTMEEIKITK